MKQEDAKWVTDERLTDTLIAIGKPSSPVQGIDNAIVFAGEKRSYLCKVSINHSEWLSSLIAHLPYKFTLSKMKSISLSPRPDRLTKIVSSGDMSLATRMA